MIGIFHIKKEFLIGLENLHYVSFYQVKKHIIYIILY